MKNARRKLEVPMDGYAVQERNKETLCSPQETDVKSCAKAHESTRQRLESSPPKDHEDHIAGKGYNSMTHDNLVHKFSPMPQAMKIPAAKAAVDKAWRK